MWKRRALETVAMLAIGDGVVQLVAPREHMLLWDTGPNTFGRIARFAADHPNLTRLLGATEIALGVWLAVRQYRED